jgi:uncharacterized DUF497 family protein
MHANSMEIEFDPAKAASNFISARMATKKEGEFYAQGI